MKIEFDPVKRKIILRERESSTWPMLANCCSGVRLDELDDRFDYGEDRWRSLGLMNGEVVACVRVELEADRVRIITMWKARRHEQEKFFRFWKGI